MKNRNAVKVVNQLKSKLRPYKEIQCFSTKPGIYAIGFNGENFPLSSAKDKVKNGVIIYIGKTQSSQEVRDKNTHFKNGRTKSSTLRRSIGAILREDLNLIPLPRSFTETTEKRFTNYKFDDNGEELLTDWMTSNLSLSFYEFSGGVNEMKGLERDIINHLKPILNLSNNTGNPWKSEVESLRKKCSEIARNADC